MSRIRYLVPAALCLAALIPARGDVLQAHVYAERTDAVHVNVFRPLGQAPASALSGPELSMFFGKSDVLVDPGEGSYPEEGGCVDIYFDGLIDWGCGPLTVEPDGMMGVTRIHGTLETTAYSYDPQEGFTELGPSTIEVDLVVSGSGPVERSPFTGYAVGVCGLPPDTRGVLVDGRPELQRTATMTGTLASASVGAIDPSAYPALLVQAYWVAAAACV